MRSRIFVVAVAIGVLGSSRPLVAQNLNLNPPAPQFTVATSVTFTIPLKLTQLSPDLEKIRVFCAVGGEALAPLPMAMTTMDALPRDEMPVVAGQLVATMSVLVPIYAELLQNPAGKTAEYQCFLAGFSKSLQNWGEFSETSTVPAFLLKPTPAPIKGTFAW